MLTSVRAGYPHPRGRPTREDGSIDLSEKSLEKLRNILAAPKAATSMQKATTPEPVGRNRPGKNWVEKSPLGHLPPYVQHVANELIKQGKTRSKAIEMAVGIVRNWSRGTTGQGGKAKPTTVAAAQLAMRQWDAMKAHAAARRAKNAAKKSILIHPLTDAEMIEYLDDTADVEAIDAVILEHGPAETDPPDEVVEAETEDPASAPTDDIPPTSPELTGPIVMKNAAKQIAYAAVLIPGEPDADGDVVSEEKIAELAWDFMENHRYMDEEHQIQDAVATPVENYLLPQDMMVSFTGPRAEKAMLPKGSWIMGARIRDDKWPEVQSGKLAGLSGMGVRKSDFERARSAAMKSSDGAFTMQMQRITFRDLGEDFIMPAVSLVGNPAVPKAKWFALKSRDPGVVAGVGSGGSRRTLLDKLLGRNTAPKTEDEEVLEVELSREELDKAIDKGVEAKLAEILGESASDDGKKKDDKTDGDTTVSFKNEDELNAHIAAKVAELLDEAGDDAPGSTDTGDKGKTGDTDDKTDKTDAVPDDKIVAAVKSAMEPYAGVLDKLQAATKSSTRLIGDDPAGGSGDSKTTYEELNRDNFGRVKL